MTAPNQKGWDKGEMMKPYGYSGGNHNNMEEVQKWGESSRSGPRRRKTRRAQATVATNKRITTKRGRSASKAEIPSSIEESVIAGSIQKMLKKARKLIDEVGWCQNSLFRYKAYGNGGVDISKPTAYDILGVISVVSGPPKAIMDCYRLLTRLLPVDSFVEWNDHPDRTKEEVLALFDEAIEIARILGI